MFAAVRRVLAAQKAESAPQHAKKSALAPAVSGCTLELENCGTLAALAIMDANCGKLYYSVYELRKSYSGAQPEYDRAGCQLSQMRLDDPDRRSAENHSGKW